jgi:SAM-dependent methyltransferase
LLRQLGIGSARQDILDLGSGTGALAIPFARAGARVTAVDPSEGQIQAQKEAARKYGVKIKFKVGHAENTGLLDHSFGAITASMCWTYFDIERMKVEAPRLLRPNGLLLVSTLIAVALGGATTVLPVPIRLDCYDGFNEAYYGRPEELLDVGARLACSAWSFVGPSVVEAYVAHLRDDLVSGAWDRRFGHLRTQPWFDGSLRLIVGTSPP